MSVFVQVILGIVLTGAVAAVVRLLLQPVEKITPRRRRKK